MCFFFFFPLLLVWLILHRIWLIPGINKHLVCLCVVWRFISPLPLLFSDFFVFAHCLWTHLMGNRSGGNSIDSMHALYYANIFFSLLILKKQQFYLFIARECSIFVLHIFHSVEGFSYCIHFTDKHSTEHIYWMLRSPVWIHVKDTDWNKTERKHNVQPLCMIHS